MTCATTTTGKAVPESGCDRDPDGNLLIEGVDVRLGLERVLWKESRYIEMLRMFIDLHERSAEEIRTAIADGDFDTAYRIAHTVKGVVGNIGAVDMNRIAAELEHDLKIHQSTEETSRLLECFDQALGRLIRSLKRALPAESPAAELPFDPVAFGDVCGRLIEYLENSDGEAMMLADSHDALLRSGLGADYASIHAAIMACEFPCALELLTARLGLATTPI